MPRGRPSGRNRRYETELNDLNDKRKLDDNMQTLIDLESWPLPPLKAVPISTHVDSEPPTSPNSQFRLVVTTVKTPVSTWQPVEL